MTTGHRLFVITCCVLLLVPAATAQALFPSRDSTNGETRERTFDVLHYRIEVTLDDSAETVTGRTTITLVPLLPALQTIDLDAEQLAISSARRAGTPLTWSTSSRGLHIALDKPFGLLDTISLAVEYSAKPNKGMYFITPDSCNPQKPRQIWTQGEDMDNHFWFPCYDFPNDKATSEVIATVRTPMTLVSNGRLISTTTEKGGARRTFHWVEKAPHSSYLIMLAAGNYTVLRDTADGTPLEYYVYPGREADARASFAETPAIMRFFNDRTGRHFPWEKYAQVAIADFMYGGMENTSATTLMDESCLLDRRSRVDESAVSLIAHEMAHQWWGDLLTCKDWRHLWLNESFASYFDPLYFESTRGRDEFDLQMYEAQQSGVNADRTMGRKPVVSQGTYSVNVYPRGASILHMMRFVLGDDLFWKALRHYLNSNAYKPVETNDLKKAVEEATGRNLWWFFDEWLYRAGHPVFEVSHQWNDTTRTLHLRVRQTQTMDSLTGVFTTPVDVEVTTAGESRVHRLIIQTADTTYQLPCPEQPRLVIFDKGNWILKELKDLKPQAEWLYQARAAANPVDRLRAVAALAGREDSTGTLETLCAAARNDAQPAVRRRALTALRDIADSTTRARITAVFLTALRDSSPAVRAAAAGGLGGSRGDSVVAGLHVALADSSVAVLGASLRSISRVDSSRAAETIVPFLSIPSRHNAIAMAAVSALANVDSTRAITAALSMVQCGGALWSRHTAFQVLRRFPSMRDRLRSIATTIAGESGNFLRGVALRWLEEQGTAAELPALERLAKQAAPEGTGELQKTIKAIQERISHAAGEQKTEEKQ